MITQQPVTVPLRPQPRIRLTVRGQFGGEVILHCGLDTPMWRMMDASSAIGWETPQAHFAFDGDRVKQLGLTDGAVIDVLAPERVRHRKGAVSSSGPSA